MWFGPVTSPFLNFSFNEQHFRIATKIVNAILQFHYIATMKTMKFNFWTIIENHKNFTLKIFYAYGKYVITNVYAYIRM